MRAGVLLSGGKDSVAAAHLAADRGWTVDTAIIVHPEDQESMLYHVPNLEVAHLQAERMGLDVRVVEAPLSGEWEVLTEAFHDLDTVITGAVASEYQRVRVERAAHRARIESHHPLWHRTGPQVLDLVLTMGMDVRFSRVAAMGLDESWVGQRLTRERAAQLEGMRFHAAGEGGEFETMVLDAPLFRSPIEVEADVVWEGQRGTWVVKRAW